MQFAEDRTFRFNVGTVVFWRSLRRRGNLWGVEGDEELGNGSPDIKIGSIGGGYLLKERRAVRPQRRWECRLLAQCTCESEKPGCQVVKRTCKSDKSGWFGAGERGEEVDEIVLDIYPY